MRRRAVAPAALSVFVLLALALPGMARAAEPAAALRSAGAVQSAGGGAYLAELVARARELKLWEERLWHLLLHYRPNTLFAGVTSEADGPGFFNAPEGKTDPQAELEGTLARFFSTAILDPGKMTSQCTFPARYHWLDAKLGFDPGRLRVQTCTRFDNWRRSLDPSSISLVFASYYFNNPASMFGHTLLVYNKKGRPEKEWLLNYAVNYAAYIPPDTGAIAYGLGGMFGGFKGFFSIIPYYMKVREYNDMESRDLWEYRLNFSQPQVDRLVRHAWEMGSTFFDYFFLKENCSYHLLSLLEVANPELRLRDEFRVFTEPSATVRALFKVPGTVTSVIYRPSRGSQLAQKMALMDGREKELMARLVDNPDLAGSADFAALKPQREALVLEAAVDFFQGELMADMKENAHLRKEIRKLLLRRAKLETGAPIIGNVQQSTRPDKGHDTSYVRVALGAEAGLGGFLQFDIQPSFHNLVARELGYAKNSQLEFFKLQVRYSAADDTARLESFTLVDLLSVAPMTALRHPFSWRGASGWQRDRLGGCNDCAPFFVNAGLGATLESRLAHREIYYAFLGASVETDAQFTEGYRAGFGLRLGMMGNFTENWRFVVEGLFRELSLGQLAQENRVEFRSRYALSRNVDLGFDLLRVNDHTEGQVALGVFF